MGEHYDRYNGMQELFATDINAATKDSTNLAEVGTDLISRQAAVDALYHVDEYNGRSVEAIRNLPSAELQIIRCKDCKFRDEDAFCTGRGFPCQLVPDDGFCDKGEKE